MDPIWRSMKLKKFKKNFPPEIIVPKALIKLFIFQEDIAKRMKRRQYSGYFYLNDELWRYPFAPKVIMDRIIPFGNEADGSIYAFWLHQNVNINQTPIVFLGVNWEASIVISSNLVDFLSLLSLGIDHLGYVITEEPEWTKNVLDSPELFEFQRWLSEILEIEKPEDPKRMVLEAQNEYKYFSQWLFSNS